MASRSDLVRETTRALDAPTQSPDEDGTLMKDVASRMGKTTSYASTYRERLLRQGVISEPDRNTVGFELPGFRDFLIDRLG